MSSAVYLDHAATAFPKAPGVAAAVARFLETQSGNPGRGGHRLTVAATRVVEDTRRAAAELLGARPERTLLGPGATFWINTVLASWLGPGDRVVTSALEHNAVMRCLRHLEEERGLQVVVVNGADGDGVPTPAEVAAAVRMQDTKMVVLTHASNVSGAVLPVAEIVREIAPVPVLVDGAQTAGSVPLDFTASGAAAYACSAHKGLLGPPGLGLLLLAERIHVTPLVRGGTGSSSESESMPLAYPDRLEAGTPNGAGAAGLGAACAWLAEHTVAEIHERQLALRARLAADLAGIPGVRLPGWRPDQPAVGVLSFTVDGCDGGELAASLDREHGLLLRAGLHCAPAAHRRLGTFPSGTLRVGIGPFTTNEHLERLVRAVRDTAGHRHAARRPT